MSLKNKFLTYLIGLIFLISGIGVVLEMFSIPFSSVAILLIGILILGMHFKYNSSFCKYISCFLIPAGMGYFVITAFKLNGIANFLTIYSVMVVSFMCIYLINKRKFFLYVSLVIVMFVLHSITLASDNMHDYIMGYDSLYIGLLLTILFVFEHKSFGFIPVLIAVVAYLIGILNFFNVLNIITPIIFKTIIALIFLLTGTGIILYNYIKSKNDNKENRCE